MCSWVEEPISADNRRGTAEVRAATTIPIAAGESEFTRFDFRDLIEIGAVDVLQPDLAICGGITEGRASPRWPKRTSSSWRRTSGARRCRLWPASAWPLPARPRR